MIIQAAKMANDLPVDTAYLDKHTVVDLPQSQQLQNLLGLHPSNQHQQTDHQTVSAQ